jgi:hypothetical protein
MDSFCKTKLFQTWVVGAGLGEGKNVETLINAFIVLPALIPSTSRERATQWPEVTHERNKVLL